MNAGIGLGMGMGFAGPASEMVNRMTRGIVFDSGTVSNATRSCPKCRKFNPVEASFCSSCGHDVQEQEQSPSSKKVTCYECGNPLAPGAKFCPGCGNPYNACPACGADNPADAAVCVSCSQGLPKPCGKCGGLVTGAAKFCPHCGEKQRITCSSCNYELRAGQKFCPECGTKAG